MPAIARCPLSSGHLVPAHCTHSRIKSKWTNTPKLLCFMRKMTPKLHFRQCPRNCCIIWEKWQPFHFFYYFPSLLYSYSKLNPPHTQGKPHIGTTIGTTTSEDSFAKWCLETAQKKMLPPIQETCILHMETPPRRGMARTHRPGEDPSVSLTGHCCSPSSLSAYFP